MDKKTKQLIKEVEKLDRYINRYWTRRENVENALNMTGINIVNNIFQLVDELKKDSDG